MNKIAKLAAVSGLILSADLSAACQTERTGQTDHPSYQCSQVPQPGEKELTARSEVDLYCAAHRDGLLNCLESEGYPKQLSVGYGKVACSDPGLSRILDHLYSLDNKVSHSCVTGGMPLSMSCEEIKTIIRVKK